MTRRINAWEHRGPGWGDVLAMQLQLHRGRRSSLLLPLLAVVLAWLVSYFYALVGVSGETSPDPTVVLQMAASSASLVQLLAVFAGVVVGSAEARPGLVPGGLLAVPRRGRLVIAKVVTAILWWAPAGLVAAGGAPLAVGVVLGTGVGAGLAPTAVLQQMSSAGLATGLSAGIGAALGVAIGSALWAAGVGFACFSLLPLLLAGLDGPRQYLPGPALAGLVSTEWTSVLPAFAASLGWAVLSAGIAVTLVERRSY